jgi:hypothetical protein
MHCHRGPGNGGTPLCLIIVRVSFRMGQDRPGSLQVGENGFLGLFSFCLPGPDQDLLISNLLNKSKTKLLAPVHLSVLNNLEQ